MEKKTYLTCVKADHKLGKNEYVLGMINGIGHVLCEEPNEGSLASVQTSDGSMILMNDCTEEQYQNFAQTIEKLYPGLCIFDYEYVSE